jgi:hypothetical protein
MQAPKKTANVRDALRAKASAPLETGTTEAPDQTAIDDARKPLAARRADSTALRTKAVELYGVPPSGLPAIAAIESGFKFSAAETDRDLNYLYPERLLAEAGELLDRCREERARRDALQIHKWKWQLELDEFLRLDQIQERERQAGSATVEYRRAVLQSAAENKLEQLHANSEAQLKALLEDLVSSGFNKRMAARELAAWMSSYPLKDRDLTGDDAIYSFDGARRTKPDHLFEAARMEADQAAWQQVYSLMAQRYAEVAQSEAAKLREESLDAQARWLLADIAFRRERAQVARDTMWEKIYQAQTQNGLLQYNERIASAERRFAADFRSALARIDAARRGMRELLDFDPPFPSEGAAGYFDDVEAWLKDARNRLAQFASRDQTYILALSLKQLMQSQWEAGRAAGEWTFDLSDALFPGQTHVRLRGIGLAVAGEKPEEPKPPPQKQPSSAKSEPPKPEPQKPEGFWSARVAVPASATVKYASGNARELDQKSLPVCFLGMVADVDSFREPKVAGANVLHNASPIGKQWKLALSLKSTAGALTEKLDDVQILLHLAVRA